MDWSANYREACSCVFSCLLGDLNDERQSFTISIYPCAMLLQKVNQLTYLKSVRTMHSSTASILRALFTATLIHPFVSGQQLVGSITQSGVENDGIIVVNVENNSTHSYSVEARNNLFDTYHPWQPMNITSMQGKQIIPVGAEYAYGQLDDSSFVTMPSGAVWQREINVTAYMPPDNTITKPITACYYVTFPDGFWAIDSTGMPAGETLATEFLTPGASRLVDLHIVSNILHLNITTLPGKSASIVVTTAVIPTQPAATEISGTQIIGLTPAETIGTSIDQYDNVFGS